MANDPDAQHKESTENIAVPPIPKETAGAVAGAALGSMMGPAAAVVGGIVGAMAGKAAGEGLAGGLFRFRKISGLVSEIFETGLLVQRQRIVNRCLNFVIGQVLAQFVPSCRADYVLMINVVIR